MYTQYFPLMVFANVPQYNIPYEANLTKKIFQWMDQGVEAYTSNFHFVVTYIFDPRGVAVDANILVQVLNDCNEWETIGNFSPLAPNPITSLVPCGCPSSIPVCNTMIPDPCECDDDCTPSDKPSLPIAFYLWNDTDINWNNIDFLWNERWPKTI